MADPIQLYPAAAASAPELPHNIEAEAALLGALMIDNRLAEDVQLKLRSDHFYEPVHGRIYDAILKLIDRAMIANPVTLRPMFESDEAMKDLGGPSYLAQLTGSGAALIGARLQYRAPFDARAAFRPGVNRRRFLALAAPDYSGVVSA